MTGAAIRGARLAVVALVALLLAPAGTTAPAPAPPAPMNNEDVVRLVVHGTAEAVVLREIAARPPAFDLEPGVVVELERVGVSRTVIEAMRRRMLEAGRRPDAGPAPTPPAAGPPATVPPASAAAGAGTAAPAGPGDVARASILLEFAPAPHGAPPPEVFAIASKPGSAPRPDDGEVGRVEELALVLLCTSATHVPDHWDTHTPLEGAPRHEVLLFRPGSHHRREHGFDLLALDRTDPGPIGLAAGRHALLAGLAGRHFSGAWRLLASDSETVDVPAGGTVRLRLDARSDLRGSRMTGYRVEQVFTLAPAPGDRPPPVVLP